MYDLPLELNRFGIANCCNYKSKKVFGEEGVLFSFPNCIYHPFFLSFFLLVIMGFISLSFFIFLFFCETLAIIPNSILICHSFILATNL